MATYVWRAENPVANVLLQHGFAEYAQRYEPYYAKLTGRLTQAGFNVHAFDLPGHGNSAGPRREVDIGQAVDMHMAARRRIDDGMPLFLVGHSLGGAITAASALREPHGIEGVVLSGPALIRLPKALVTAVASLAGRYPSLPFKNLAPNAMTLSQDVLAAVATDPLMCRGKMPLGVIGSLCTENLHTWRHVQDWTLPTLLIHGDKDKYTNPKDSRRFFNAIKSADKTLRMVEGGYHETLNDPEGAVVAEELVEWLRQRATPSFT